MDDQYDFPEAQPVTQANPGQDLTNAAAASIPDPWGPADDLHLTRLNNDASKVREEFGTGNLDQQAFDGLMGQINKARQPMLQRQQQAKQAAQAEQRQQALHDNAFAKSIQLQDQQADLQAFRLAKDPETGARFAPKGWAAYEPMPDAVEGGSTVDEATGLAENPEQPRIEARMNADGTHHLTIYNGDKRSEVDYGQDQSSPTGMRVFAQQHYDENGQPIQPKPPGAVDPIRRQAENELGRPEPRKWVPGPGGRSVISPEWEHWDTGVRQIDGRLRQQDAEQKRHANAQVETAFKDSLANHPLKSYADAANPNVARMDAIMDDFAKMHPNDKRVLDWQAQRSSLMNALAKKEPSAMTLGELATAANGAHVNVQTMIEKAEKEIKADDRVMPENTTGRSTGITYNPKGGHGQGPWQHMDPEDIHAEAVAHVRSRLTQQLADQRKAAGNAPAPEA